MTSAALTRGAGSADDLRAAQMRAAPWPYTQLDVAGLIATGWRPTPVHDVVLKVHQRCNLACDYCYVYEHADQSWRDRPSRMSPAVWQAAVEALGRHVRRHDLKAVRLVLHGGEPLLYGAEKLGEIAKAFRSTMPDGCLAEVGMQTNGVRLDRPTLEAMQRHQIRVGVSVDGVADNHDRHRRTRSGRGSYAAVSRSLQLLGQPEFATAYAGILCTVAADTDPHTCYEQLLAFRPPMLDFLLPHANHDAPPPDAKGSSTPYADWLNAVFDRWYADPPGTRVRLFEDVMSLLLGGPSRGEQLGLSPSAVVVVESDGAFEQVDALKTAYSGAAATGLNVLHHEFDDVLADPGIVARQIGVDALAEDCLACPLRQVCGGGHYAHRYRSGLGFRHRSVYCDDLKAFIAHVSQRMTADLQTLRTQ
jgi:uncharacterized protein